MTPAELEKIKERSWKATNGPWKTTDGERVVARAEAYGYPLVATVGMATVGTYTIFSEEASIIGQEQRIEHDAEFIAHARTDIPTLLEEVAHMTAERDRLRAVVDKLRDAISAAEHVCQDYPGWTAWIDLFHERLEAAEAAAAASKAQGDTK